MYELAARNNVVIVGRGGQMILRNVPGALHARIIAPFKTRVRRVMKENECEEKIAERMVRQHDRDSSGYLSTYFGINWDDNELYDLVINTRAITLNQGVALLAGAADTRHIEESPPVSQYLYDLALSHKGKAALLAISKDLEWVELEVKQGVVTLSGIVDSTAIKHNCQKTILNIKGIKSVDNQLIVRDSSAYVA